MSYAMYPKVFEEYMDFTLRYSQLVEKLPTRAFLCPLEEDEEVEVELAKGVNAVIKYKAVGELQPNGKREVFFEANGVPRVLEVVDRAAETALGSKAVRDKVRRAEAKMAGTGSTCALWLYLEDRCADERATAVVSDGVLTVQPLVSQADLTVLGSVGAPMAGTILEVAVKPGMMVSPGQQLAVMSAMKVSCCSLQCTPEQLHATLLNQQVEC
eukprot:349961-Chlamydomonas_euryale.AAC.11